MTNRVIKTSIIYPKLPQDYPTVYFKVLSLAFLQIDLRETFKSITLSP